MEARFKVSYFNKPIPGNYKEVLDALNGKFDDFAFRWSYNGVPHLLIEFSRVIYSLCYFKKFKSWRLFYPYQTRQIKTDFDSWEEALKFILLGK